MFLFEMTIIKGLQEHVGKFRVTDARVAILHARTHAFLGNHTVDGEMLADVAQEIEQGDVVRPVSVVQQACRVFLGLKIKQLLQLLLYAGDVGGEHFVGEQVALSRFAAGIADGAGGAAGEWDGDVAEILKPAQRNKGNQVAHVQAVSGWVKTAVKNGRTLVQAFGQRLGVGAVIDQSAPGQFVEDTHLIRAH